MDTASEASGKSTVLAVIRVLSTFRTTLFVAKAGAIFMQLKNRASHSYL